MGAGGTAPGDDVAGSSAAIDVEPIDVEPIDVDAIEVEPIDVDAIDVDAIDVDAIDVVASPAVEPADTGSRWESDGTTSATAPADATAARAAISIVRCRRIRCRRGGK